MVDQVTPPQVTETISSTTTEEKETRPPNWVLWSAASYAIVMLVLGLPLWWKTTAVQRAFLPYDQMLNCVESLQEKLKIGINVNFNGFSSPQETSFLDNFGTGSGGYKISYSFRQTSPSDIDVIYKSADPYKIDSKICAQDKNSETFNVYYVGRADFLKQYGHRVILGNCRSAYYISNSSKMMPALILKLLQKLIPSDVDPTAVASTGKSETLPLTSSPTEEKLQLPLSLGYDILLSLVIPEPEVQNYNWDIDTARTKFINPILRTLSNFSDINVSSQYIYYMKLNFAPKYNKERDTFEVPYDQLPLVINPVEAKLTSFVSQNSALNFLIYTAPCEEYPLHILGYDGSPLPSNSFLVPQWGGIQVYNAPCKDSSSSKPSSSGQSTDQEISTNKIHNISIGQIVSVIVSQFRDLIGIPSDDKSIEILQLRGSVLRDWEVDVITRKRLHDLLYTTANTLQSLGQLLDQITNIMVTEEVGLEVEHSVDSLFSAVQSAIDGKLSEAQKYATSAYKASEIAFHHPTNLAQLYFPDDQKYAIYIPLFLPIGIPVLVSLKTIFVSCLRM